MLLEIFVIIIAEGSRLKWVIYRPPTLIKGTLVPIEFQQLGSNIKLFYKSVV